MVAEDHWVKDRSTTLLLNNTKLGPNRIFQNVVLLKIIKVLEMMWLVKYWRPNGYTDYYYVTEIHWHAVEAR